MTKQKKIAVLGANGRMSREVARAFHAAGWHVHAITRNGKSEALAKLADMQIVESLPDDADAPIAVAVVVRAVVSAKH